MIEPSDTSTRPLIERLDSGGLEADPSKLAPEVYQDSVRRLSHLALIYAVAYFLAHATTWTMVFFEDAPSEVDFWRAQIQSSIAIGGALAFFLWIRRGKLPHTSFTTVAVAFEVLAALGISYGAWGWETHAQGLLIRMAEVQGLDPGNLRETWIEPLVSNGLRPAYSEGVPWVGVWLVVVPLVLPLPARATLVGSFLAASTVPLVMFGSPLVNGVPDVVAPWKTAYVLNLAVPTYVCAVIAVLGSRVLYQLTHALSRAHRLGSYQLVEKIGEGGMGEVWRAKHRMLVRPAAIKLIRPEALGHGSASSMALRRFEREAQVIGTLTSPHTVALYDFGITGDQGFYYVMELLDGLDLRTLVERHGPVGPDRTRFVLQQVCHSLDDAHAHGLTHRDIKPGNIFLCRRGNDCDVAKVLDFGLVKESGSTPDHTQLTLDGITTGTPAFMAPEMALGRDVDARADLYALGCVAFWLLTGELVFKGDTPLSIVTQHVSQPPPRVSSCTELEVPRELDDLIDACLAKDPELRPQSAAEISRRLREVPVVQPWTPEQAAHWWASLRPTG